MITVRSTLRTFFPVMIVLTGLLATPARAQTIDRVDIVAAGLMKIGKVKEIKDSSISTGQRTEASKITVVKKTSVIKATTGTVFGLSVAYRGKKSASVTPKIVWRYPAPGMKNPDTGITKTSDEYMDSSHTGGSSADYYWRTSSDWTIVPGPWTFELWDGARLLASTTFTIEK